LVISDELSLIFKTIDSLVKGIGSVDNENEETTKLFLKNPRLKDLYDEIVF